MFPQRRGAVQREAFCGQSVWGLLPAWRSLWHMSSSIFKALRRLATKRLVSFGSIQGLGSIPKLAGKKVRGLASVSSSEKGDSTQEPQTAHGFQEQCHQWPPLVGAYTVPWRNP